MNKTEVYWTLRASNIRGDKNPVTIAAPTREEALALAEDYEYKSDPVRHAVRSEKMRKTFAELYEQAKKGT